MSDTEPKQKRPSKKTDMLEVRVSPEEKAAFLEACRRVGRSASAVIRDAMRAYASFGPMARRPGSFIMIASAFAGASLGAWALFAFNGTVNASPEERIWGFANFVRIDANRDQVIEREEYWARYPALRDVFAGNNPDTPSARRAELLSMFAFFGLDPRVFTDHASQVSEDCWIDLTERDQMVRDAEFLLFDTNRDDRITPSEFSNGLVGRWTALFDKLDRNGDGILDRADRAEPTISVGAGGQRVSRTSVTTSQGIRPAEGFNVRPYCPDERVLGAALPRPSDTEIGNLTPHTELVYQCTDCNWLTILRSDDLDQNGSTTRMEFFTVQDRRSE